METNNHKISVVIPSYNHAKYVSEAIESVLNQTYDNFELIIIDDASPDNSIEIISQYKDPRIVNYNLKKNVGAVSALNFGITHSNSEYFALLNSDDYWEPQKLEKQMQVFKGNQEIGAVFTSARFINENKKPLTKEDFFWADIFDQENRTSGEWLRKFFFELNCLCHPSILIKKNLYQKTKLYNPAFRQLPDFAMWINLLKYANIHVMKEKMVNFRIFSNEQNTSSVTYENRVRNKNELFVIMSQFFNDMKDSTFIEGFHDGQEEELTPEEIQCEQALLYFKDEISYDIKPIYNLIGISKLSNLLHNESTKEVLEKKYNFYDRDLYDIAGKLDVANVFNNSVSEAIVESAKRKIKRNTKFYKLLKKIIK